MQICWATNTEKLQQHLANVSLLLLSPLSVLYTALSNCANSPNSWVLCAFLCYYLRCCLVPPRIRLSENFLYLIWPTVGACFTQLESHQRIQNTASKFHTPFTPTAPAQASLLAILSFVQFPSQLAIFPSANQLSLYFPIQRQRATIIS